MSAPSYVRRYGIRRGLRLWWRDRGFDPDFGHDIPPGGDEEKCRRCGVLRHYADDWPCEPVSGDNGSKVG